MVKIITSEDCGKLRAFCDVYEFSGVKGTSLKEINSYPNPGSSAPEMVLHDACALHQEHGLSHRHIG